MDMYQIWAYLASVSTAVFTFLYMRRGQIYVLLMDIARAAKDDKITEEEFQQIVDQAIKIAGIDIPSEKGGT